jgi:hypothetical protein
MSKPTPPAPKILGRAPMTAENFWLAIALMAMVLMVQVWMMRPEHPRPLLSPSPSTTTSTQQTSTHTIQTTMIVKTSPNERWASLRIQLPEELYRSGMKPTSLQIIRGELTMSFDYDVDQAGMESEFDLSSYHYGDITLRTYHV